MEIPGFPFLIPSSSEPHFELFHAAYNKKLNRFKRLALEYAKGERIGVAEAIGKVRDKEGRGSLHLAAAGGSLDVCKYLIEKLKIDVETRDVRGGTPLCHATIKGHFETVRYLLEKGANPDVADGTTFALTPLHYAAKSGNTKIITLLLSKGVRIDVESGSGTALQCAAALGHRHAVKMLLEHGANPNGVNCQDKRKPLDVAIFFQSWECVELLLKAGADPNAESYGGTPLTLATIRDGCVDGIKRLLEAGADPNYKMDDGKTALEIAAMNCNYQVVEVLFPVTSRIPTYPDWSITGLMMHLQGEVLKKETFEMAKSKGKDAFLGEQYLIAARWYKEALDIFPNDAAVLSNMSACYAHLNDGITAHEYAVKCKNERPEWPKAYYRMGVALNMLKRYDDAAESFSKGLALDPGNKELKDAYMEAIEARLNSTKIR